MSGKIRVEICTGTTCFVMGGAELLLLEENLPEHLKDQVEITGTICMNHCKSNPANQAPYVRVNDKVIKKADLFKILDEIKRCAGEE